MFNKNKFLILALTLVILLGCSQNFKAYDYKSTENKFPWGAVSAKLLGRDQTIGNSAIKGSPYKLLIWFSSSTIQKGTIHISELKLIDAQTSETVFEPRNINNEPFKQHESSYEAFFSFNNLELEYVDMVLLIKFSLEVEGKITDFNTEIRFTKDFKEYRRPLSV